ncbi:MULTISPECIES: hypothetical protein [Vreelandella]|uniref:Uncharacterized protein n=2 Tax=Vreelandella TaxID=3137766 RepID=A0A7C9JTG6_9GAMM|nr:MULTISPECIES: hypothetical protein [Halomonas]NDL70863.1 hypothetical protein [Halomonas alkaliphila]NYS45873.1 hypothetical protein [Halomonas zhaodongensis]
MFNRQEWASLLGIYGLGAFLYALLLTPGFTPTGVTAGLGFMFMGLVLGLCGAVIGRRSGRATVGIVAGYLLFIALVTTNYWLSASG